MNSRQISGNRRIIKLSDHLATAARLDPTIPGVNRLAGLALLRAGRYEEAAQHWRKTWRREGEAGNMLIYAIPVANDMARHRARFGTEHVIADLAGYTLPAIEQNAVMEGMRFLQLDAEERDAKTRGAPFPPEKALERDIADYRMNQFLAEYVSRGEDLQELALQKGLLPAIHHRDMPAR